MTSHDLCGFDETEKVSLDRKFRASFDYAAIKVQEYKKEVYEKMRKKMYCQPHRSELTAERFMEWQLGYWGVLDPFQQLNLSQHKEQLYKEMERVVENEEGEPISKKKKQNDDDDDDNDSDAI